MNVMWIGKDFKKILWFSFSGGRPVDISLIP